MSALMWVSYQLYHISISSLESTDEAFTSVEVSDTEDQFADSPTCAIDGNAVNVEAINIDVQTPSISQIEMGPEMKEWLIDVMLNLTSEELIENTLRSTLRFSREELLAISDIKLFAKNIAKVSTLSQTTDDSIYDAPLIDFSFSTSDQSSFTSGENASSEKPYEVRANFTSSNYSRYHVIARWYDVDTNTLMSFDRYPVTPYSDNTHIWLRRDHWPVGNYRVDIFQENSELSLLSHGTFTVGATK